MRFSEVAGMQVRRMIPSAKLRYRENKTRPRGIGPFLFLDETRHQKGGTPVTSSSSGPQISLCQGPHPHIGISTLTYLLEGAVLHRDSTGGEAQITPGEVNWLTAGRGAVHWERPLEVEDFLLHGFQFWVALPKEHEQCEPRLLPLPRVELTTEPGVNARLLGGHAMGRTQVCGFYILTQMNERSLNAERLFPGGASPF